ncbi:hypothetical protein M501DRAFT_1009100 [Patellaria atrata CBS 101060]|uniref:Uncharacterized protein n=1 Tax=Patellaria atrata CBS 101060 TaxID=1346257 RepID=A0A9P4VKN7_9PEZI|nr:hypothetical protein M501DRAFT_1009100 [Patellaria atrata CBS 101060]
MEVEAATSAPSIIPFSRNDHFVGRESHLAELEANLLRDKQTTVSAIVGPEGVAVVQAAAYINIRNVTLQEYRSQLVKRKKEALEHDSELSKYKLQEYGIKSFIATTLLISMDQIRRRDTLAADYLFLAACVDRKDIPLDYLQASLPREREDAIKVLSSYALIIRRPAESALDVHQLVHRALRE